MTTQVHEIAIAPGMIMLLDDEDLPLWTQYDWKLMSPHKDGQRYIYCQQWRDKRNHSFYLHRLILDAPPGMEVDHINGNALDNRRANLRLVTRLQNAQNLQLRSDSTTGVRGVSWAKRLRRFHAYVNVNGRRINLGYHKTLEEAAAAAREGRARHMTHATN